MSDKPHSEREAGDRAHGTHGQGDSREERVDDVTVEPATREAARVREASSDAAAERVKETLTGHMGDANWGDAASGGSTIDKRSPKKHER
jgi:hypothetical protein